MNDKARATPKPRDRDALADPAEVSAYLRTTENTLRQWRYLGRGPRCIRVGRFVRYRWSDVDRWLEEQCAPGAARPA